MYIFYKGVDIVTSIDKKKSQLNISRKEKEHTYEGA
jgi:hypothetical protein